MKTSFQANLFELDCTAPPFSFAEENKHVARLCEVQRASSSVSAAGLSLASSSLSPLLRALKLQSSLTELRLSGNRLGDDLLPELVAAALTMSRLRLLDVSACLISGDGLEKAVGALRVQSQAAFPVKSRAKVYSKGHFYDVHLCDIMIDCPPILRLVAQSYIICSCSICSWKKKFSFFKKRFCPYGPQSSN